jgi:hypothetical protein
MLGRIQAGKSSRVGLPLGGGRGAHERDRTGGS